MNNSAFLKFKKQLADRFVIGCEDAVDLIKADVVIDTQRLFESTRIDFENSNLAPTNKIFKVKIVAGGIRLYGIRRERNIAREVDYAIKIERRDGYMQGNIPYITRAILDRF